MGGQKASNNTGGFSKAKKYHEERRKKRKLHKENLVNNTQPIRQNYDDTTYKYNSLFKEYYTKQLAPYNNEGKLIDAVMESFASDLPATIRIYMHSPFYKPLTKTFQAFQEKFQANPVNLKLVDKMSKNKNGKEIHEKMFMRFDQDLMYAGPSLVPWYPVEEGNIQGNAWRLGTDRLTLRKHPNEDIKEIHKLLVREAQTENITRQEEVSMIPVLLLGIKRGHAVFDACAAPGSKTAQMLELLLNDKQKEICEISENDGFLVANDSDPKRAYMLHHQLKRFNSPQLMITCADAQLFPEFNKEGLFDRILCDVPCSGDGTLRKNPDLWRTWNVNNGTTLHPLQIMILWKSLKLLKTNGRLVYSTCTLNPVEDEAVIGQILRMAKGSIKIIDPRQTGENILPKLKSSRGLKTWNVAAQIQDFHNLTEKSDSKDGAAVNSYLKWFESLEDFQKFRKQNPIYGSEARLRFAKKMHDSMFPPTKDDVLTEKQVESLENCMRILPNEQNTGGFFVCLIEKIGDLPVWNNPLTIKNEIASDALSKVDNLDHNDIAEEVEEMEENNIQTEEFNEFNGAKLKTSTYYTENRMSTERVDQYKLLEPEIYTELLKEFEITPEREEAFHLKSCLHYRPPQVFGRVLKEHEGKLGDYDPRAISFISPKLVSTLLKTDIQCRLNIVSCGVPIFRRSDRKSMLVESPSYRLTSDGVEITARMVENRLLQFTARDLNLFMNYALYEPKSTKAKQGKNFCPGVPFNLLSQNVQDVLNRDEKYGSYIACFDNEAKRIYIKTFSGDNLYLVVWKAKKTLAQLINAKELTMLNEQLRESGIITSEIDAKMLEAYFESLQDIKLRAQDNNVKTHNTVDNQ